MTWAGCAGRRRPGEDVLSSIVGRGVEKTGAYTNLRKQGLRTNTHDKNQRTGKGCVQEGDDLLKELSNFTAQ